MPEVSKTEVRVFHKAKISPFKYFTGGFHSLGMSLGPRTRKYCFFLKFCSKLDNADSDII
jgi:hypothetical protein